GDDARQATPLRNAARRGRGWPRRAGIRVRAPDVVMRPGTLPGATSWAGRCLEHPPPWPSPLTSESMSPRNRTAKAGPPARGSCRWLNRPNARREGGVLAINGTPYEVLPLYEGDALVGYRLLKADGRMYDVDIATWRCDCPDATYRERFCKH